MPVRAVPRPRHNPTARRVPAGPAGVLRGAPWAFGRPHAARGRGPRRDAVRPVRVCGLYARACDRRGIDGGDHPSVPWHAQQTCLGRTEPRRAPLRPTTSLGPAAATSLRRRVPAAMAATPDYPLDLGAGHVRACGGNEQAQRWFSRAMLWAHGFNFSEATECCRRAFAADPTCAMARWGEALCMGPNYNDPVLDDQRAASALQAAQDAVRLLDASSAAALAAVGDTSAALVRALPARLGPPTTSREEQDAAYAIAMAAVYESYGDSDADVAFAYADALMQLNPWRLWTGADTAIIEGDFECQRPSDDNTTRLIAVLEKGLTLAPRRRTHDMMRCTVAC